MIIKRKKIETMEVEQYLKNDVIVFYNDDYYKETYNKVVKITPLLPKGKWFLFDSTRVYRINSNEEMFDIDEGEGRADFEILEHENISLFIDEVIGQDTFVSDFTTYFDEIKNMTVKDFMDKLIVKHSGVLKEDGSIITLEKL